MSKLFLYQTSSIFLVLWLFFVQDLFSQAKNNIIDPDSILFELEPIIVTASRFPVRQQNAVVAVTALDKISLQTGRQLLTLKESLGSIPGLLVLSGYNFAQDLRLSIRGFGSRSPFGIRGIKILIDGIPETTPDGQTQLDNFNIGMIDHIEVMRGPASSLYGNASGGVMHIISKKPPKSLLSSAALTGGSFGYRNIRLEAGKDFGKTSFLISGLHTNFDGYREQSKMRTYLLNGFVQLKTDSLSDLTMRLSWEHSPVAEDPGALTLEQLKSNPEQASMNNIVYNAGESVSQGRIGLHYEICLNPHQKIQTNAYYTHRSFDNRLPFEEGGSVGLQRDYGGMAVSYLNRYEVYGNPATFIGGVEYANQQDDRKRYNNMQGIRGKLVYSQEENYLNYALFAQQELKLSTKIKINLGVRYDVINVDAKDLFNEDGNNSGRRSFKGTSGMVGLLYHIEDKVNVYGNISSGFETPALIELTNNPQANSGLNPVLDAQKVINYEIGLKGILYRQMRYELALFSIDVDDEILPFEKEDSAGRIFYRNAGQSRHSGIEFAVNWYMMKGLSVALSYSYSRFRFVDYQIGSEEFSGNTIPGIPEHMWHGEIFYINSSGLYTRFELQRRGKMFVNDANTAADDNFTVLNIQAGFKIRLRRWTIEPFSGINNLTNISYSDNVRINAFGARYYEPAPGIYFYLGVNVITGN
jgi:iron complex outermembrane receptor protein